LTNLLSFVTIILVKKSLEASEPTSITDEVRRRLAVAALTLATAAFAAGGPVASAGAATHKVRGHEQHQQHKSLSELTKQTIEQLAHQEPVAFFNGSIVSTEASTAFADGISGVSQPLLIYIGNPKDKAGKHNLEDGNYVFGYINHSNDKPNVTLFAFDKHTMRLIPGADNMPKVDNVVFRSDDNGGLDFNQPFGPEGPKDVPYIDQYGNPLLVAVAVEAAG
jgi:hypothetical protein